MSLGFRTNPTGGIASPPYTQGPYSFSEDISFNGNFREMPNKYCLVEYFKQLPALNAVLALDENSNAAAHLAYNVANKDFEVLGTNMTTALVTRSATNAAVLLTTAGADNDQAILLPHQELILRLMLVIA